MRAFIDDGYTLDGFIAADLELDIESVEFKYRPATAKENTAWQHNSDKLSADDKADKDCKFLSDHIVAWPFKKQDGSTVEINAANCGKLNPVVSIRLINIISGWAKSDAASAKGNS